MDKRHILICGERGVGKSTLIRRLLDECTLRVGGFTTVREKTADERGFYPIYLHPAAKERSCGEENLIGRCDSRESVRFTEVFDTLGVECLCDSEAEVLLMDELGFLENDAEEFKVAVLCALAGDTPVIAAVKAKCTPFLDAVRASEKASVVHIDADNRDALFDELLPIVRAWSY